MSVPHIRLKTVLAAGTLALVFLLAAPGSSVARSSLLFRSSFEALSDPCEGATAPAVTYRAGSTQLQIHDPVSCSFRDFFIAGINLGIATPGKYAGDLETAATYDDFQRWFGLMADAGINVIRVYTLHMDFFYDALRDFNLAREANGETPLYLAHGIWLEEESPAVDLYTVSEGFSTNIQEVVHAVHGNIDLDFVGRPGKGYGTYTSDVSRWVLAWIIGREVHPDEVLLTNESNLPIDRYEGTFLSLPSGSPAEAWITSHMDEVLMLEQGSYGDQRPISFSSWPTLDPLTHPTEINFVGVGEDFAEIDLRNIDAGNAPAGVFYSYHAYPYYPDFISEDPVLRKYTDAQGPNSYLGYLGRLRDHYSGRPVVIAEFGVPSSWGNVHTSFSGMHHGGHDERQQGLHAGRMLRNLRATGLGGGMLFAWLDEWWKPTWLTNEFDFPFTRRAYWHNIMAPEQNFGLIGFPPIERPSHVPLAWVGGRVTGLSAFADTSYYRLLLDLDSSLETDDELIVLLDTYGDARGEASVVSDATVPANQIEGGITTSLRPEFLLHVFHDDQQWMSQLYVSSAYDLYGLWRNEQVSDLQSPIVPTDRWNPVLWKTNYSDYDGLDRFGNPYESFYANPENIEFNAGTLQVRPLGGTESSRDAVIISEARLELRLPWGLLQFSDPSQHQVFHDDEETASTTQESLTSEGIAQAVILNGNLEGESARFLWNRWLSNPFLSPEMQDEPLPDYQERIKQSYFLYGEAIAALPEVAAKAGTATEGAQSSIEAGTRPVARPSVDPIAISADALRADLSGADLHGRDLRGRQLTFADLGRSNLHGADLRDASLREAWLYRADLSGADLRRANLRNARLAGARLAGAIFDDRTILPFSRDKALSLGMVYRP